MIQIIDRRYRSDVSASAGLPVLAGKVRNGVGPGKLQQCSDLSGIQPPISTLRVSIMR